MVSKSLLQRLENTLVNVSRAVMEYCEIPQCKYCRSRRVVRYGHYQMIQRWWCKDCKRKFINNDSPPNMKTSAVQIAAALSMFYEGMSLNGIRRHLNQTYNNLPSDSSVYGWIVKYTRIAVTEADKYRASVSSTWIADETVLKIDGANTWFWDIIDQKTRFLLASHISTTRTQRDATILMRRAAKRAGKTPATVLTDKLGVYLPGVEAAFGSETEHIASKGFNVQPNTNIIERFHGSLKCRTKVMRGMKKHGTATLIMNGWLVHYNFFRQHESLKDKTPAEKAGIKFPFKNWLDVVKGDGNGK